MIIIIDVVNTRRLSAAADKVLRWHILLYTVRIVRRRRTAVEVWHRFFFFLINSYDGWTKREKEKNGKQKPIFRFDYSFVSALGRIVRHCKMRAWTDDAMEECAYNVTRGTLELQPHVGVTPRMEIKKLIIAQPTTMRESSYHYT